MERFSLENTFIAVGAAVSAAVNGALTIGALNSQMPKAAIYCMLAAGLSVIETGVASRRAMTASPAQPS